MATLNDVQQGLFSTLGLKNSNRELFQSGLGNVFEQIQSENQKLWEREDTAYQRMVADMKKAGLNPWTGISSGGLSSSAGSPTAGAFDSLIAGLSYNLDLKEAQWNKNDKVIKNALGFLRTIMGSIENIW